MKQLSIPVVVILFFTLSVSAGADEVDRHVMQGIDQMYAVRFDDASRSFDKAIAADRNDPRGYFYRATVHLWSYVFDKRQQQLDLFLKLSDQAISVAERRIAAAPGDSRAKIFLGMSYGYKAIANGRAENFMAAALSARTCYDKLNDLVRNDPRAYDAYLGLGLFHFLFGSVPKAAQFMAGLSGIKGDAKLGIKEIETVASKGTYFKNDAQLILALLNIYYVEDVSKGLASLEALAKKYPRNVAMLYAIGTVYSDKNQPDRAIPYYERIIREGNRDFGMITDMSTVRCGIAYYMKNDFARAKPYLQKYLKSSKEQSLKAYAWYLLGHCFEIEGSRESAVKAYGYATRQKGEGSPEDRIGRRKAAQLLKTPLSQNDIALLRAVNSNASGRFDEGLAQSTALLARRDLTPAQRAQSFYTLGESLREKGQWKKAIDAYKNAIAAPKHSESWIAPFSHLHLAECYLKLGDREKWRANIDLAKRYTGYDNEPLLRYKLERDVTLID